MQIFSETKGIWQFREKEDGALYTFMFPVASTLKENYDMLQALSFEVVAAIKAQAEQEKKAAEEKVKEEKPVVEEKVEEKPE